MAKMKAPSYKRASSEQIHLYRKYVKKHPALDDTRKNSLNSNHMQKLWTELANSMNSLRGPKRSAMKWRESLLHWKHQHYCRIRKAEATAQSGTDVSHIDQEGHVKTTDSQTAQQPEQTALYGFHAIAHPILRSPDYKAQHDEASSIVTPAADVVIKEENDTLDDSLNSNSSLAAAHTDDDTLPLAAPSVMTRTSNETCVEMCQQVMSMLATRDERERSFQQDCLKLQQTMAEALNKVGDALLAISQLGRDMLVLSKNENLLNGHK